MSEQQYPTTKVPAEVRAKAGRAIELAHSGPPRGPVLPRLDVQKLSRYLPRRNGIRIEINGMLAGAPLAVPDAVTEFAIGWAFMNRFFSEPGQLSRTSATASHVSLMIDGGADLEQLDPRRLAGFHVPTRRWRITTTCRPAERDRWR